VRARVCVGVCGGQEKGSITDAREDSREGMARQRGRVRT